MDIKFSVENNFKGNAYSRRDCIYLLISLEYIPKVFSPGNSEINDKMNELALEEECANTTIRF